MALFPESRHPHPPPRVQSLWRVLNNHWREGANPVKRRANEAQEFLYEEIFDEYRKLNVHQDIYLFAVILEA